MAGEQAPQQRPAIDPADYDIDASRTDLGTSGTTPEKPTRERAADGTFLPGGGQADPQTPPETPKHPGYLVEFAKDFGFSDEEINSMSSEMLGRNVQILRSRDRARQQQLSAEYQIANPRAAAPPPPQPAPEPDPVVDLGIDEAEFGPEMVKLVKKVRLDSLKENQQLKKELAEVKAKQAQVEQTATANHLDTAFDALGADYEHIFGSGQGSLIEQDNPDAIDRRVQAVKAVARKFKINPFAISPKSLAAKIKQHADSLYQVKAAKPAEQAPADPYAGKGVPSPKNGEAKRFTDADWQEAGLARPTARKGGTEPDGELKAIRNLEAKQRELGMDSSVPNASEMDGFL